MPTRKQQVPRETWRDWQPKGTPEPTELLSREEVANHSLLAGTGVTADLIKYWEFIGALPKAVRKSHHGTVRAVYPGWYPVVVLQLHQLQQIGVKLSEMRPLLKNYIQVSLTQQPDLHPDRAIVVPESLYHALDILARSYEIATGDRAIQYAVTLTIRHDGTIGERTLAQRYVHLEDAAAAAWIDEQIYQDSNVD
jgi:DNA-binding transcriptional MerR regulator